MHSPGMPPLTYFNADDVVRAMPDLDTRLALAERTLVALVADAELPPKIGIHPRPDGSFAHAMPAYLRGERPDGAADLVGMKWVAGFASNRALGLPAISAVVLLNDPANGLPVAILDGGPITAARTAAVSGVAIRHFAPVLDGEQVTASGVPGRGTVMHRSAPVPTRRQRAALIGAGVQGRSHVAILGHVLPGVDLVIFDRHLDRADALAAETRDASGIGSVAVAVDPRAAVDGADVVITAASFGPLRQVMTSDWLAPDALVVPVDYATYLAAEVARDAGLFMVDHREQFLANRDAGLFEGYPEPSATIGEALLARTPRPASGRVVATHLGVGLADLVFGDAIVRRARELGLGLELPR